MHFGVSLVLGAHAGLCAAGGAKSIFEGASIMTSWPQVSTPLVLVSTQHLVKPTRHRKWKAGAEQFTF